MLLHQKSRDIKDESWKLKKKAQETFWAALLIFLPNQLSDGLVWHTIRAFCSHMKILSPTCCGCCASILQYSSLHIPIIEDFTLLYIHGNEKFALQCKCFDLCGLMKALRVAGFSALRLLVAWPMDLPLCFSFQLLERWRIARSYFVSPTQKTPRCPEICRDKPASKIISWLLTRASGSKIGSHQFSVLVSLL